MVKHEGKDEKINGMAEKKNEITDKKGKERKGIVRNSNKLGRIISSRKSVRCNRNRRVSICREVVVRRAAASQEQMT